MFRLDSKVALRNGAGRGAGLGRQRAQQGAYVSVNDFHVEGGPGLRAHCRRNRRMFKNSADENLLGLHPAPHTDKGVALNALPR